jgi:uncharacterized protein YndB with AHSA1/START domain
LSPPRRRHRILVGRRDARHDLRQWIHVNLPKHVPQKKTSCLRARSSQKGYDTRVEMVFKPLEGQATMVQIRESGWRDTPQGVESSYGNCGGWMHMLCCCKAFLEHGINLRAGGAF